LELNRSSLLVNHALVRENQLTGKNSNRPLARIPLRIVRHVINLIGATHMSPKGVRSLLRAMHLKNLKQIRGPVPQLMDIDRDDHRAGQVNAIRVAGRHDHVDRVLARFHV